MAYADGIRKATQVQFGGYNHNLYAGDGELWDMKNMTGDYYPLLSPRKPRYKIATLEEPNGFYAKDGLYWADGTGFYADGELVGTVKNGKKRFAGMGAYIIIMPDKAYYNRLTGQFGNMEAEWSGSAEIQNGTYVGESAQANTIYAAGAAWGEVFRAGDAVTISGCTTHTENNKTTIIREIDGDFLRFYENTFVIAEDGDEENMTLRRTVPDLDYICENENRLWGCREDTIYASKQGDPFNWNVYDGTATDSFTVNVGSAGDFTGCYSYLGYPCFFKEENIYKVYGDRPANFQVMGSASLGVEEGSGGSLAVAGEVLFYLSRSGITAYSGGIPQNIAAPFGTDRYRNAVAGSDGIKYYISMRDADGKYSIFVYDTRTSLWHKEDDREIIGFGWDRELHFLDGEGNLWLSGNARSVPDGAETEETVESMAEFGDFAEGANHEGTAKIQMRISLDEGATVKIYMQFDSDGQWREVTTLKTTKKRSFYLPIIPRRSDHFKIRLEGTGDWKLYSLTRENYSGSEPSNNQI